MIQNPRVGYTQVLHHLPGSRLEDRREEQWSQFRSSQETCLLPGGRPRSAPVERQPVLLLASVGKPDGRLLCLSHLAHLFISSVSQQVTLLPTLFQELGNQQCPRKTRITVLRAVTTVGVTGRVTCRKSPGSLQGCPWGNV